MNKCSRYRTLLVSLLEDELSPAMREELLQHIAECTQCALEYSRLQKLGEVMTEDEVVLPREGRFEMMKQRVRQQAIRPRRRLFGRLAKVFVPACALAAALSMIFRGRGETVEMSIPVAHLLEDRDIAEIAMSGIVSRDVLEEIGELEGDMVTDTDEMIDEMSDFEKKELVNSLYEKYAIGT